MNKQQKMYQQIEKHGKDIIDYFGLDENPIKLCKKLRRIETEASKVMTDACNIPDVDVDGYVLKTLKPKLVKIFGIEGIKSIYINHDPRGYTLKVNEIESKRINGYKDWGGYFILAPDFRE